MISRAKCVVINILRYAWRHRRVENNHVYFSSGARTTIIFYFPPFTLKIISLYFYLFTESAKRRCFGWISKVIHRPKIDIDILIDYDINISI